MAPRNVPQQAPTAHNLFVRPAPLSSSTPPKQRLLKPHGIDYLLNPTAKDTTSAGGRQPNSDGTDSPWTAPIAASSRPATPPCRRGGEDMLCLVDRKLQTLKRLLKTEAETLGDAPVRTCHNGI